MPILKVVLAEIRSLKAYQSTQTKKQASQFFYFDVASAGMDPDSIVSATLRLYQTPFPGIPHGGRQQVRYIDVHIVQSYLSTVRKIFNQNKITEKNLKNYFELWNLCSWASILCFSLLFLWAVEFFFFFFLREVCYYTSNVDALFSVTVLKLGHAVWMKCTWSNIKNWSLSIKFQLRFNIAFL